MPRRSVGRLNVPSLDVYVWTDCKSCRLRAMMSALPTGLEALVTVPRTLRTAGRGASERAGTAAIITTAAMAIARNRRIYPSFVVEIPTGKRRPRPPRIPAGTGWPTPAGRELYADVTPGR